MNAVDTNALDNEILGLVRLLRTNHELLQDGVISERHWNRNKKIINDRIKTLVDTFGSAK